ncbi:MAG: ThiF family adenylyltransferase [Candidatus Saccharimonadaceae bacterium]
MTVTDIPTPQAADFSDQAGIFDPNTFADTITLIGCGGIGASALPTLVTMGFRRFELWDPDLVEPRNVASQLLYKPSDLYRSKVEVASEYLLAYGAREVVIHPEYFTADTAIDLGVVISGVDSMAARQIIWEAIKRNEDNVQLYLDGRIGGQHMQLLAVEPIDGEWYEKKWLFNDDKAAPLPCTERAIAYPAVALGSFMASHLAAWNRGNVLPKRVDLSLAGDMFYQVVR